MSDARSLLRAKKASTAPRVTDPNASYNAAGDIRCTLCAMKVTQWAGHVASKQHRTSVAREKEDERKRLEKKRPAPTEQSSEKKRKTEPSQPSPPTLSKLSSSDPSNSVLPPGFFSDPSKAPQLEASPPPEEASSTDVTSASNTTASAAPSNVDDELDEFLASIASAPAATASVTKEDKDGSISNGMAQTTYEAEPVRIEEVQEEVEEDAGAIRRRKEQEEKEEIILRLEEEERAQDDAFDRVASLKAKHAALKKKREEAKLAKKAAV